MGNVGLRTALGVGLRVLHYVPKAVPMKDPKTNNDNRVSSVILGAIVIIAVVVAIVFTIYVRFTDPFSGLGASLLESNPLIFAAAGAVLFAVYISAMLRSRRDSERRGWLGRVVSATITLRLAVVMFLVGAMLIGLLVWGLARFLLLLP